MTSNRYMSRAGKVVFVFSKAESPEILLKHSFSAFNFSHHNDISLHLHKIINIALI